MHLAVGVDALGQQVVDRHVGPRDLHERALHTDVRPVRAPAERPIGACGAFTIADVMLTMRPKRRSTMPSITARIITIGASMFASSARPGVAVPVLEAPRHRAAVVGDQDVRRGTGREQRRAGRGEGDVAGDDGDPYPGGGADLGGRGRERLGLARVDRHVDAFARERLGARLAQPLAGGAHDRVPAANPEVHVELPPSRRLRSPGRAAAAGPTGCLPRGDGASPPASARRAGRCRSSARR